MTNINNLIEQYGYITLIIVSIAEGETITILGGIAAHQGLLRFPLVVAAVALGGIIGDQLLYLLGVYFGHFFLHRLSKYQKKIDRANQLIHKYPWFFVIGTRFMYGFRILGPLIIGSSRLSPKIFFLLNIIGAIAWALIFTTIGYLGGETVSQLVYNFIYQH